MNEVGIITYNEMILPYNVMISRYIVHMYDITKKRNDISNYTRDATPHYMYVNVPVFLKLSKKTRF